MTARTKDRPRTNTAGYEDDFFAWTQEQARLLRARAFEQLDIENVAEEIESLGRGDRRELRSRLAVLLTHLLKWRCQPGARSRSWQLTILEQRRKIDDLLEESPSLRPELDGFVSGSFERARDEAAAETALPPERLPEVCPWTLDQILDRAFLPPDS